MRLRPSTYCHYEFSLLYTSPAGLVYVYILYVKTKYVCSLSFFLCLKVPVRLEIEGETAINSTDSVEIEFNLNFNSFESRYPTKNAFSSSVICPQEPSTEKQKGLSSGGVTGVAIGCIVLGLCLGGLVVYLWFKRRVLSRMGPPPMKFP